MLRISSRVVGLGQASLTIGQNILALLLRPLRLFVPGDSLRVHRIVLLKATHWPFVALILGYERGRHFLHDRRRAKSSFTPVHPSSLLRRPKSTHSTLLGAGTDGQQLDRQTRAIGATADVPTAAPETIRSLEAVAANLKTQLDAVNSLIELEKLRQPSWQP